MHLVYIDDSGTIDINDSENFVFGGIIINEDRWFSVEKTIKELKNKYFGTTSNAQEFHMCDLINRKGNFSKMELIKRREIAKDLFECLKQIEFRPVFVIIKKKELLTNMHIKHWAFKFLFERICYQLENLNSLRPIKEHGIIIMDSVCPHEDEYMWNLICEILQAGSGYEENKYVIEGPIFTKSHLRSLSQIADVIAYTVNYHHKVNKNKDEEMHKILEEGYKIIDSKIIGDHRYSRKIFP